MTLVFLFLLTSSVYAIDAGEQLGDAGLEKRAVILGDALRCMVCQSESINDSPADLAKDLRKLVREKITAGLSDDAVLNYIHDRYGDYVLLKPPLKTNTAPLWFAPWIFLALGFGLYAVFLKRTKK
jgi:cytochrome c-type biogenesis protein CcmH